MYSGPIWVSDTTYLYYSGARITELTKKIGTPKGDDIEIDLGELTKQQYLEIEAFADESSSTYDV